MFGIQLHLNVKIIKDLPLTLFSFQPTTPNFTSTEPASFSIRLHDGAPFIQATVIPLASAAIQDKRVYLERFQSSYGGNYIFEQIAYFFLIENVGVDHFPALKGLKRKYQVNTQNSTESLYLHNVFGKHFDKQIGFVSPGSCPAITFLM